MNIKIYCDGGSRGNPGPAAIGVYIVSGSGIKIGSISKQIGVATNNEAEYQAVIEALKWLKKSKEEIDLAEFYLDSELIVNQLNGTYRVRNSKLRNLILKVRLLESQLNSTVTYRCISRKKNCRADKLVNDAFKKVNGGKYGCS